MKKKFLFNPLTGKLDLIGLTFHGVSASAPSAPSEGDTYINSSTHGYYIYYGGTWQLLHTLTGASYNYLLLEDGFILLKEDGDKIALEA